MAYCKLMPVRVGISARENSQLSPCSLCDRKATSASTLTGKSLQRVTSRVVCRDGPAEASEYREPVKNASTSRRLAVAQGAAFAMLGSMPVTAQASPLLDERIVMNVFDENSFSTVYIVDYLLAPDGQETPEGVGSGFVWDQRGHIVTNYHVIAKLAADTTGRQRTRVGILQPDGLATAEYQATVVGIDPAHDLAVLHIDAPEDILRPVKLGTSSDLKVGQYCYAIGNPFGLGRTLTAGVISGLNRRIPSPIGRPILGVIQTDASINSGNSGGPLLDSFGHLIGVNVATFTKLGSGRSSGVNFALPVDLAYGIVPQLIVNGRIGT